MALVFNKDASKIPVTVDVLLTPGPSVRPKQLPYPFLVKLSVPKDSGLKDRELSIQYIMSDSDESFAQGMANIYSTEESGSEVCWYADLDINMTSMRGPCKMDLEVHFCHDLCNDCGMESIFVPVPEGKLAVYEDAPPPSLSKDTFDVFIYSSVQH